jgi:hypothetical protein
MIWSSGVLPLRLGKSQGALKWKVPIIVRAMLQGTAGIVQLTSVLGQFSVIPE